MTANRLNEDLPPVRASSQDTRTAAIALVEMLLDDEPLGEPPLCEASVHRPRRSRVWVATFTGPRGGQVWKSTGLMDRDQALLLAKSWEAEARGQRVSLGHTLRRPILRVGRQEPGSAISGLLTQKE